MSHDSPRSFIVDTGDGVYRRNRRHLLPVPKDPQTSQISTGIPTPSTSSELPRAPDEHLPERPVEPEAAMDASNQINGDLPPILQGKCESKMPSNNNIGRIYLQEWKPSQENQNVDKATFLNLEEQIIDACIKVETYDKRDAFKFEIINYPDLSSNIPTKPAYGFFTSHVIRYVMICIRKDDLIERFKGLTKHYYRNTTQSMVSSHH